MPFEITLTNAGKRFNRDWIFRGLDFSLTSTESYAVTGTNGSGKSTALRCMLGYAPLSEGEVTYNRDGAVVPPSRTYLHMAFCSPYLELYEELTVREMAKFHFSLKPMLSPYELLNFGELTLLEKAMDLPVKHLSSGMKQRLRLGLTLYSSSDVAFLDEPTSNLDRHGIAWYKRTLEACKGNRLFIVASNHQEDEYYFCTQMIDIGDFKPRL